MLLHDMYFYFYFNYIFIIYNVYRYLYMHRVMYISYSEQCVYKVALYINWCDFPNISFIDVFRV